MQIPPLYYSCLLCPNILLSMLFSNTLSMSFLQSEKPSFTPTIKHVKLWVCITSFFFNIYYIYIRGKNITANISDKSTGHKFLWLRKTCCSHSCLQTIVFLLQCWKVKSNFWSTLVHFWWMHRQCTTEPRNHKPLPTGPSVHLSICYSFKQEYSLKTYCWYFSNHLPNCMVQGLPWFWYSLSWSRHILLLWNLKVYQHVHRGTKLDPILNKFSLSQRFPN
jgi:hypothetical protein